MAPNDFLKIGNPRKVQRCLSGVVDQQALDNIELKIREQVQLFFTLSLKHFRMAKGQNAQAWRQKVSRFYYAAYTSSRMVRYYCNGDFATDTTDHKKVGDLPKDFPNRSRYKILLDTLREDRNTGDYDHLATAKDLVQSCSYWEILVTGFLQDSAEYLRNKGVNLRGKV